MANLIQRVERKLIVNNTFRIGTANPWMPQPSAPISNSFSGEDSISDMMEASQNLFKLFKPPDKVMIKINLNSANPYPASTSSEMLEALLKILRKRGINHICIADCSGLIHLPTRKVIAKKKFNFLKKYKARIKSLDYGSWVKIPIRGEYFKDIILAKEIYKYDRFINLANLKSHSLAGFSFATKSLVGLMHPKQRYALHRDHLQERIAEIALAVQPDLNIIDARKIFVTGGPDQGKVAEANTILIGSSLLALDLEAYNLLLHWQNKLNLSSLPQDPYSNDFFNHLRQIQVNQL
ncbi:MAG: DUF362 domain-containing protein [Actinomycetota bacterium]|nr:DUF362 domain-containing protein [Actinomycetota bacterium]